MMDEDSSEDWVVLGYIWEGLYINTPVNLNIGMKYQSIRLVCFGTNKGLETRGSHSNYLTLTVL